MHRSIDHSELRLVVYCVAAYVLIVELYRGLATHKFSDTSFSEATTTSMRTKHASVPHVLLKFPAISYTVPARRANTRVTASIAPCVLVVRSSPQLH
jgi:hypothetical protein